MKQVLSALAALLASMPVLAQNIAPETRRVNVVDTPHGERIEDPYRWLEEVDTPEVRAWAAARNADAEAFAGPGRDRTRQRLLRYAGPLVRTAYQRFGPNNFFRQGRAGSPHAGLLVETAQGEVRRLAGPDVGGEASGGEDSVGNFWPSPDGALVLVVVAPRNTRWGRLDLIEASSGRTIRSHPSVFLGATAAAWLPDGSAYAYSHYERDGAAPVRGSISLAARANGAVRTIFAPRSAGDPGAILTPHAAADANRLFVEIFPGSRGTNQLHVIDPTSGASERLRDATARWLFIGARGDWAWLYTDAQAPNGRIVRLRTAPGPGPRPIETVIPESDAAISATSQVGGNVYGLFGDRIVLLYRRDAVPVLRIFGLDGRLTGELEVPPTGSIWGGLDGDPRGHELFYQFLGVAEPASIYRVDVSSGRRALVHAPALSFAAEDIVATRTFVAGRDGARIPVLIAHRRGLSLDRPRRAMLYGYGAFGWVSFLWYQPHIVDWLLEDDALFVVAGVRGGGEYGTAWHEAGRGLNRGAAIDDYLAVARHLVARGMTRGDMLVANGGSISGGLVAQAVNLQPDLFGAMVLDYPALDLIRYPRFGAARNWAGELGSPDDPQQFRNLLAVSPYHRLQAGTCYPATLIRTGQHDPVVTPAHGFKFAAALRHASPCANPVLLDVMEGASHDYGATPDQIARSHAVMLEFLRRVLPGG